MPRREVVLLVYDGVQLLDVAGPADVFDAANRVVGREVYRLRTVAPQGSAVVASNGLRIGVEAGLDAVEGAVDTLLVAGGWGSDDAATDVRVVDFVRRVAPRARRVVSVCTGAFVLAEAGVLAGRRATTHWSRVEDLAECEDVRVEPDRLFVHDGAVSTAAGVSAGIDLALSLVEQDLGGDVVRVVCRWLVVFLHRPGGQSQFSQRLRRPAASSPPVRAALDLIATDPTGDYRVERLAATVGMSRRHFAREFRRQAGMTPGMYVEAIRLETAQGLLEGTREPLAKVARLAGFGSEEAMRQSFHRRLAITPGEYRERFHDRSAAGGSERRSAVPLV